MSDPLSSECAYCGSKDVLDDAWFCGRLECWQAYERECRELFEYEQRTPLTRSKALTDLGATKASTWGIAFGQIISAGERLVTLARPL